MKDFCLKFIIVCLTIALDKKDTACMFKVLWLNSLVSGAVNFKKLKKIRFLLWINPPCIFVHWQSASHWERSRSFCACLVCCTRACQEIPWSACRFQSTDRSWVERKKNQTNPWKSNQLKHQSLKFNQIIEIPIHTSLPMLLLFNLVCGVSFYFNYCRPIIR